MHEIMSGMSTPTVMQWAKLNCLAWYMLQYPEERWDYKRAMAAKSRTLLGQGSAP